MKAVTANVFRETTLVGRLSRTKHGSVFEYDDAFLKTVASSDHGIASRLPYESKRFETTGVNLHTFFAGLLPEGLRLRALVGRVKTSEDDLFSLLIAAGADCVGDVSVAPAGKTPEESAPSVDATKTEAVCLANVLARSLRTTREATIPGVQEKVSAAMISLPVRARGAAYILKLNPLKRIHQRGHIVEPAECGRALAAASPNGGELRGDDGRVPQRAWPACS